MVGVEFLGLSLTANSSFGCVLVDQMRAQNTATIPEQLKVEEHTYICMCMQHLTFCKDVLFSYPGLRSLVYSIVVNEYTHSCMSWNLHSFRLHCDRYTWCPPAGRV